MTTKNLTHLQIKLRHNFGRVDYVAMNDAAKVFCNGKGAVPGEVLRRLKEAGFTVEEVS